MIKFFFAQNYTPENGVPNITLRRSTDNTEKTFTYEESHGSKYTAWIGAATAYVVEVYHWGTGVVAFRQDTAIYQPTFDGISIKYSDYQILNGPVHHITNNTFSVIGNIYGRTSTSVPICKYDFGNVVGNQRSFALRLLTSAYTFYVSPNGSFSTNYAVKGTTATSSTEFVLLAGTYDGTNMRIYEDGVLTGTKLQSGGVHDSTVPTSMCNWYYNNPTPYTSLSYPGRNKDFYLLYDRVLTPQEIEDNYNGIDIDETDLLMKIKI